MRSASRKGTAASRPMSDSSDALIGPVYLESMSKFRPDCDRSRPVIRMINQNRHRPVNLLGQHDPAEAMGPGHQSERQHEPGILAERLGQSIRPADEKGEVGRPPL